MRAIGVCLRFTLLGLVVAVLAAFAAVVEQLFPSASALASLGLLRTLALPLASLALELALLSGVPLGFAVGVARAAPNRRELWMLLALPALLAAPVLLLSRQVDVQDDSPGSVAERLIIAARQSCSAAGGDVPVPIVKVTLHCADGRLSGAAPFARGTFSAAELAPNADLSALALERFELSLPAGKTLPALRVRAAKASVSGLRPWGRARSQPALRFLAAWLAVIASSVVVALLVRGQSSARAFFIGLGTGLAAALAALALERRPDGWAPLLLPLSGVAAALIAQLAWDLGRAYVAHFQTLPLRRQRAIARAAGRWYSRRRPEA